MKNFHKMLITTLVVIISTCLVIGLSAYSTGNLYQVQDIIHQLLTLELGDVKNIIIKVENVNFY